MIEQQSAPSIDSSVNRNEETQPGPVEQLEISQNEKRNKTKREKWSREEYIEIMWCHYHTLETTGTGNVKKTFELWRRRNPLIRPNITANTLANQRRYIMSNNKLTRLELDNIQVEVQKSIELNREERDEREIDGKEPDTVEQQLFIGGVHDTVHSVVDPFNEELFEEEQELSEVLEILEDINNTRRSISTFKRDKLPKLNMDKKKINVAINKVNKALKLLVAEVRDPLGLSEVNKLMYAAGVVTCKLLEVKQIRNSEPKQNKARDRLNRKIAFLRKELSQFAEIQNGVTSRRLLNIQERLYRKYHIDSREKEIEVIETIKQKLLARAQRLRRYKQRQLFFLQNKTFKENPKRFYQEIGGSRIPSDPNLPPLQSINEFWSSIWGKTKTHNKKATWIERQEKRNKTVPDMGWIEITKEEIAETLRKTNDWKAPGQDGVQNFWIKRFSALHHVLAVAYNDIFTGGIAPPEWLTSGITYLIPKSGNASKPEGFRPITCLSTMYKNITSILSERIYTHLEQHDLYPIEQKGCLRNCYGCKDQLLTNKMIVEHAKKKCRNLSMGWVDYRKAFDSVPHSWILKVLRLYKINPNILTFIEQSMLTWKTMLTVNSNFKTIEAGEINIKSGIFQGDSLSPLLFCMSLFPLSEELAKQKDGYRVEENEDPINHLFYVDDLKLFGRNDAELKNLLMTVKLFSDDIQMCFGLDKCSKVTMVKGKIAKRESVKLEKQLEIKELKDEELYKYLGFEERAGIEEGTVKEKIKKEYFRRVRLILESQLTCKNKFIAIKTYALPVISYGFGIINWKASEIQKLDRKTRKMLTLNKLHHPKADVERLYLPRCEGGRGMCNIEDTYKQTVVGLAKYLEIKVNDRLLAQVRRRDIENGKESLITKAQKFLQEVNLNVENMLGKEQDKKETQRVRVVKKEYKKRLKKKRQEEWLRKVMHGQIAREYSEEQVDRNLSVAWLTKGNIKGETEALIVAAQDQAIATAYYKKHIFGMDIDPKCRLCKIHDETIFHIMSGCPELAKKEYLDRHNNVCANLHYNICKFYEFPVEDKWYQHIPNKVTTSEEVTVLWDMQIQTDRHIPANKPDIVIRDKRTSQCYIVDVSVPADGNVGQKGTEKILKYRDLQIEIQRMWNCKAYVIPIIIGSTGIVHKSCQNYLKNIPGNQGNHIFFQLQRSVIFGTAHVIRRCI